jgi:uncharacterized protein YifN (PemK superfamily)
MTILFHPRPGAILLCDYTGFRDPEMVKVRPVVVLSPRLRHRDQLCTVVPLSTTAPFSVENYHCCLAFDQPLPSPWHARECWVKADMLATVGFHRLDRIRLGRGPDGKRKFLDFVLPESELQKITEAVLYAIGLGRLTKHL